MYTKVVKNILFILFMLLLLYIIYFYFLCLFVFKFLQKDMDPKCLSCERVSDVRSSNISGGSPKKPNLEFTLGTPQWCMGYYYSFWNHDVSSERIRYPLRKSVREKKKRKREKKEKSGKERQWRQERKQQKLKGGKKACPFLAFKL